MDLRAIQRTQIKVAGTPPAKDKARLPLVLDAIEESKAMHDLGRGIALPLPTLPDRGFMQLAIIAPDPLREIPRGIRTGERMSTNATSIHQVRFL